MLRRIYDWCIDAAHKPYALWILGAVAFAESSFFPIPPDVMLVPMVLANRRRAFLVAGWCTLWSVLGGALVARKLQDKDDKSALYVLMPMRV